MKKLTKLFIILFLILFICACKDKKTEYKLIEITGEELVNNLYNNDNQKFIFALYNTDKKNADTFYQSLENIVNNINSDVYYVEYNHLDDESSFNLYTSDFGNFAENSYYLYDKGKITISSDFTDFAAMYKELKTITKTTSLNLVSAKTKEEYLKQADQLYNEGQISQAFNYLNKAWNTEEAKKTYQNNKYYKLINSWEAYKFLDDQHKKVEYYSFFFISNVNYFYQIIVEDNYQDFEKPNDLSKYEKKYYYIKDDIIYISNYDNGKYKETYQIESINEERLTLIDIETKEKLNFAKRS